MWTKIIYTVVTAAGRKRASLGYHLSSELKLVDKLMEMFQATEDVDQLSNSLGELWPCQYRVDIKLLPPRRKSGYSRFQETGARWQALTHYMSSS